MSVSAGERRRALAFLIGAGGLLVVVGAILGVRVGTRDLRTYQVVFQESVAGLERTSQVEYMGVPVGTVTDIRLRPGTYDEVVVELGIEPGVPIKADMRARLRNQGITGLLRLELVGGSPEGDLLAEGGTLRGEFSLMHTLTGTLSDVSRVASDATALAAEVSATLKDMRAALTSAREAADAVARTTTSLGEEVREGGQALRSTAERVNAVLADPARLREDLAGAARATQQAMQALQQAAAQVGAATGENRAALQAMLGDLRQASADLREAAAQVRRSPASLLVEHPVPEKEFPDPLPMREERP